MAQYNAKITDEASDDMEDIFKHIAFKLLAPENAANQYDRIADAILSLEKFPERYRIMDEEPMHSRKIRCMPIDNYVVLFYIKNSDVIITDVLYGASDIAKRFNS